MDLVSCIMPTANRRAFIPATIELFQKQDYGNKELIIIDDGQDSIHDLVPRHSQIRYFREQSGRTLGEKRNLACEMARGEIIAHWDDDDWYASWRIRHQVELLRKGGFDLCGVQRPYFVDAATPRAWEYIPSRNQPWVCGATLCYLKSYWQSHRFSDRDVGEDTRFVYAAENAQVGKVDDNRVFVGRIHRDNSARKRPRCPPWYPRTIGVIQTVLGVDWEEYFGGRDGLPLEVSRQRGVALVAVAAGIGDTLRVTPLIRAAYRLGYTVDVLIAPDDASTPSLLRGAREIRHVYQYPGKPGRRPRVIRGVDREHYDIAAFTKWALPLRPLVKADTAYAFGDDWQNRGDIASVSTIAHHLGWEGNLPAPFAMKSNRRFTISPRTIAMHPGCKANWPWKKWHGFAELASLFESIVVLGTESDRDNRQTYFKDGFKWPSHVKDFTGKLTLRDTAALIAQCAALVSLDSGLMHLGVTLNVPTFGIFGITSPERECFHSPFMTPITKGLSCEPSCRKGPWGRRNCAQQLACLQTLTSREVAARIVATLRSQNIAITLNEAV